MSDDLIRLAVLIDADNTSPKMTRELFDELAGYGTLTVKRAYGDWTNDRLRGWKNQLHKHAISPIQQFANTSGKNATDSALIIDAMDLLYAGHLDGFVIVSSDADFTRLATRLRESGKVVYGVGQRKTPKPFQDACDKFTFLEVLRDPDSDPDHGSEDAADERPAKSSSGEQPTVGDSSSDTGEDAAPVTRGNLQSKLTKALNKMPGDDDNWATLGALGNHLNRTDPSFDPRTYDFAKLSDLVKAQPYLETKSVQGAGGRSELWARLKGAKPSGRDSGGSNGSGKDAGKDAGSSKESGKDAARDQSAKDPSGDQSATDAGKVAPTRGGGAEDRAAAADAESGGNDSKGAGSNGTGASAGSEAGPTPASDPEPAAEAAPAKRARTAKKAATKSSTSRKKAAAAPPAGSEDQADAPPSDAPADAAPTSTKPVAVKTARKRATRKAGPATDA